MQSLSWLLVALVPLVAALVVAFGEPGRARQTALLASFVNLGVAVVAAAVRFSFGVGPEVFVAGGFDIAPALGLSPRVGADGMSVVLVLLSAALAPMALAFGVDHDAAESHRSPRPYYAWMLVLVGALQGVFVAGDVVTFYLFFELTMLPLVVLTLLYGGAQRRAASMRLFVSTFLGSLCMLVGLLMVVVSGGETLAVGFDRFVQAGARLPAEQQVLVALLLCVGFAVKTPLMPLHSWQPLAYTQAPLGATVLMSAVLAKMGTYGFVRLAAGGVPTGFAELAPVLAVVCCVTIVAGGLIAWVQREALRVLAYSSMSHLGFCVLGLAAVSTIGVTGSIVYMVNHGLTTAGLFLCVGVIRRRYGTSNTEELGGVGRAMPRLGFFLVFFAMASIGLPGLNGFVGEFLVLIAAFVSDSSALELPGAAAGVLGWPYAVAAGFGIVLAAIYMLSLVGKLVFGRAWYAPGGRETAAPEVRDISGWEVRSLGTLAVACVVLGVYPKVLIDVVEPVAAEVSRGVVQGGRLVPAVEVDENAPPPPMYEAQGAGS